MDPALKTLTGLRLQREPIEYYRALTPAFAMRVSSAHCDQDRKLLFIKSTRKLFIIADNAGSKNRIRSNRKEDRSLGDSLSFSGLVAGEASPPRLK